MHSPLLIIAKYFEKELEDQLSLILKPFNEYLYDEPMKQYYVRSSEMKSTMKTWNASTPAELLSLMQKNEPDEEIGLDDEGIWELTECNNESEWDYWVIGGRYKHLLSSYKIKTLGFRSDIEDCVCEVRNIPKTIIESGAIVTPDGSWNDSRNFGLANYREQCSAQEWEVSSKRWREYLEGCFIECQDYYAVIVDVHS